MSAPGLFHWSKDFVEHLRAVHFALVVVSLILISAENSPDANHDDPRRPIALKQIEEIATFEKNWAKVPRMVYAGAMRDNDLPDHWRFRMKIVIPREYYAKRVIETDVDIPVETLDAPGDWRFEDLTLPQNLTTLSEFEQLWNRLHEGATLLLPINPRGGSECLQHVEVTKIDGSEAFPISHVDALCRYGIPPDVDSAGPAFPASSELSVDPASTESAHASLDVVLQLPLDETLKSKFRSMQSASQIDLKLGRFRITERYLGRVFFEDWRAGDFAQAFPELNSYASGISALDISDAAHGIKNPPPPVERYISILGFSVPLSQVSTWGVVILLSVQLYFWLHLHELVNRIEPAAEGWNVAWIGLYAARASFVVAVISSCALPIAATVTLASRIFMFESYYRKTTVGASLAVVVFSLILSILTGRKIYQLRQSARLASVTQPDTDPV